MSSFKDRPHTQRRLHLPGHDPESVDIAHPSGLSEVEQAVATPSLSKIEKVVAGLSPLFAVAVGWLAQIVARYFPGMDIPRRQLIWAFVVGVSAVVLVVLKWLHSRDHRIAAALHHSETAVLGEVSSLTGSTVTEDDVRKLLDSHRQQVDNAMKKLTADVEGKLPPAAAEAVANLLSGVNLGDLLTGKASAPAAAVASTESSTASAEVPAPAQAPAPAPAQAAVPTGAAS